MIPAAKAESLTKRATISDCEEAVAIVLGAFGVGPGPGADRYEMDRYAERIGELAEIMATESWTRGEVIAAARRLTFSVELKNQIRFGRTLTPADFAEQITGEKPHEHVRRQRLYTFQEAMAKWRIMGEPGCFAEPLNKHVEGAVFEPVQVEGRDKPMWRMK